MKEELDLEVKRILVENGGVPSEPQLGRNLKRV